MERIHHDDEARGGLISDLEEIARQGARRMLKEALEAEVEEYVESASLPGVSGTRRDMPSWRETAMPGSGRSYWGRALSQ